MTRYERPISAIEKEYTDVEEAHSAIQEHQRLEGFVCVKAGNSRNRLTGVVSYRSDEEAPAADHGEPEPDDMRPQQQISDDPAPLLDNTVSSDEMPSDDEGNGDYAPGSPVGQTSGPHRTRVPSSGKKGGNRQGSVSARLDHLQSTVSKLLESVEALRDAHYATQAALAAQAAHHPPWQHHANPASQHQNFPVTSWPTQQSETAQSNAQPPQTGRVSQFINSQCAGPNFLASQSNEHMASGYTAGLHYPAAQRPR
ncbi:hypothetical protein E4U39_004973 [Claviceps sp. Clav50 group G5]|nr:hypothetical protein E4U39_004973 [Claviceps sp. Clav50 group G5]